MSVLEIMQSSRGKGKRPKVLTEEQRANLEEWKRINATLTLEKMVDGEPYIKLPYQYRAATSFDHEPPEFSRGFEFTQQELSNYAASNNIVLPQGARNLTIQMMVTSHITSLVGRPMTMDISTSGKLGVDHLLLTMYTNSGHDIPQEEIDKIIAWFKDEFNKEPRWYITDPLEGKHNFKIPERLIWGD
ncbi:hypothetical protein BDN72DRAFT_884078 [Pluteus cervinus]|uniref:Uncharacterized protein n=1 Tax=Pluteus cervinus TaxID=181527 RepID=A0ACD3A005_9AGAR|nr:hypothetical protein BDN72DRAFT_884078 [Pluteus cervinus]